MVCDAVLPGNMPAAEAVRKRNPMPTLAAAEGVQTSAARTRHDRFDHQSRHMPGVLAHMTIHATLRTLEMDGSLLARDVEDVKDRAQFRVERQHFDPRARDVAHVKIVG